MRKKKVGAGEQRGRKASLQLPKAKRYVPLIKWPYDRYDHRSHMDDLWFWGIVDIPVSRHIFSKDNQRSKWRYRGRRSVKWPTATKIFQHNGRKYVKPELKVVGKCHVNQPQIIAYKVAITQ